MILYKETVLAEWVALVPKAMAAQRRDPARRSTGLGLAPVALETPATLSTHARNDADRSTLEHERLGSSDAKFKCAEAHATL